MQNFRGTFINKHRDAWVEVNLGNLEHNILEIKKQILKDAVLCARLCFWHAG